MEVGGPFWTEKIQLNSNNERFFNIGKDNIFTMSGRTAIDIAIQEISCERKVKTVYFPSYSCDSMIQPFIDRNIEVIFYEVYFDNGLKYNIDINQKCDIFFAMNYFGYTSMNMEKYIKIFSSKGSIVIEDITHSLLSKVPFSKNSDYLVASLRKWFPIYSGGIVSKIKGNFIYNEEKMIVAEEMIKLKKEAMELKSIYINDKNYKYKSELKENFLNKYKHSNEFLKDYRNKSIDLESKNILMKIDIEEIKSKIKENIKIIYENISFNDKYTFLISEFNFKDDVLLYVPLYFNESEDLLKIKKTIYENEFYCPSHWPVTLSYNLLYEKELSLICDYRYNPEIIKEKIKLLN